MSYEHVAENTIDEPRDEFWIATRGDKAMIMNKQAGSHPTQRERAVGRHLVGGT